MNTVEKGNSFENIVFKFITNELLLDRLHVTGKRSKVFQKKSYYSKDRQSDIITDISIETFLPDASDFSLLTIIECKHYNSPIPVDDIEEFHSKVQQIAGDNIKAIFVTTAALQKSALNYAKSKKIGVIRFLPDEQVKHLLYRSMPPVTIQAFLDQDYRGDYELYAYNDGHISPSMSFILDIILNENKSRNNY